VVETGGLENRCTGNRTGGSNPSPSAIIFRRLTGFMSKFDVPSRVPVLKQSLRVYVTSQSLLYRCIKNVIDYN
jgi:hypothetical protein